MSESTGPGDGGPFRGLRVVEVASWVMGPTAGAVMAEWGADVVKVERPGEGDPSRGLRHKGRVASGEPLNVGFHHANRNKRSVGLDVGTEQGHALLMELVDTADVFLTNFLPPVRQRLGIDVDDVMGRNPRVIYARVSALGPEGPESSRGGYDYATFWCRGGVASALHSARLDHPPEMPSGAMGDMMTGALLAGAVGTALFARERTGRGQVVDASLMATGAWLMAMNVAAAASQAEPALRTHMDRDEPPNPLVNIFRTADGRFLSLCLLQQAWGWPELCDRIGRPDLAADERLSAPGGLGRHSREVTKILDEVLATRTLAEWAQALDGMRGVWEPVADMADVASDPQVEANGYLGTVDGAADVAGAPTHLVTAPVRFAAGPVEPTVAPELGQHTEEVLLELGHDWDAIAGWKDDRVIT